ncbi:MAG: AraC family transcriptional regulator, partial [Bryobacterales bacterium]|nr:AraC family transcriptional regulator [Bryobacterales bacterium]
KVVRHSAHSGSSPLEFAHFGMLLRGNCWLSVEGIPEALPLAGGDCFLLAPGSSYTLRDNIGTSPRSFCEVAPRHGSQVIQYGGGGAPTTIVSGWFHFDRASVKTLKRLLPLLILVRVDQAQGLALHTTINMLASELAEPSPGSDLVVNRLADVLFVQCIRAYFGSRPETCRSGLGHAIFDPQIGVALKSMHERVDFPWTVESLAAACGMSRSAFALRFKELVRETPLEYLTNWRMQKATAFLRKGDKKLFEVAKAVGYDSDAAFSKAFRRVVGVTPRAYGRSSAPSVVRMSY